MECDFSRGDMHQSRERGEENYNIKMLHVFFHQGYGQAVVLFASLPIAWEDNIVTQ